MEILTISEDVNTINHHLRDIGRIYRGDQPLEHPVMKEIFKKLSLSEFRQVAVEFARLEIDDRGQFSRHGTTKGGGIRFSCSRGGGGSTNWLSLPQKPRHSNRCGCPSGFIIKWTQSTIVWSDKGHNEHCYALSEGDRYQNVKVFSKCVVSAELSEKIRCQVIHLLEATVGTTRNSTLESMVHKELADNGIRFDSTVILNFTTNLINQARREWGGNLNNEDCLSEFVGNLEKESRTGIFSFKLHKMNGKVNAISFRDEKLCIDSNCEYSLLTVDVTHGISSGQFSKWSIICGIRPDGTADVLTVTCLHNEDTLTFSKELAFLKAQLPWLHEESEIVIITDEDYGRINALEFSFPKATIRLCYWHKLEMYKFSVRRVFEVE